MVDILQQNSFSHRLLTWHDAFGRHDLPWQRKNDDYQPYHVWVSEVMLQQTQVATVIDYYQRFMQAFPTVDTLADASWDEVASLWAGLGYYARARNLHKAAKTVQQLGAFPTTLAGWQALSGIGASTAGAIMAMGCGQYGVILDGNVKRVLTRHQAIADDITKTATQKMLWQTATDLTPLKNSGQYAQAIMDVGATVCTRNQPKCHLCPVQIDCQAHTLGQQTAFPYKKKKPKKPTKHAYVFILQHEDKWLWYQRPETGIWAGLWCLPILDLECVNNKQDTLTNILANSTWDTDRLYPNMCLELLDVIKGKKFISLTTIKHTFTHFHWMLTPVICHFDKDDFEQWQQDCEHLNQCNETSSVNPFISSQWLTFHQFNDLAKPKAMEKILTAVVQKPLILE